MNTLDQILLIMTLVALGITIAALLAVHTLQFGLRHLWRLFSKLYEKFQYRKFKYECGFCRQILTKFDCTHCHGLGYYPERPNIKCEHTSTTCTRHVIEQVIDGEDDEWEKEFQNLVRRLEPTKLFDFGNQPPPSAS